MFYSLLYVCKDSAATNRNLEEEIKKGNFRSDLYHRLNVYPLITPPLRDHIYDIPLLVGYFCDYYQRRLGCKPFRFSEASLEKFKSYNWPGNGRELKNIISRATLHASQVTPSGPVIMIEPQHLFMPGTAEKPARSSILKSKEDKVQTLQNALTDFKKDFILKVVKKYQGNWSQAANELGLHRSNLYHLRDQLGLKKDIT